MKININWGWGIVIALATFMIFISSIVLQLIFDKKYEHQLVSENYYKDELLYQLEVDKIERAEQLTENVSIENQHGKVSIIFPKNMNFKSIEGTINLQYIIDEKFDLEYKIKLNNNNVFVVDSSKLKKGKWQIKVDWNYQNISYLLKENIVY